MEFLSIMSAANSASAYETRRSCGDSLPAVCPARNVRPVVGVLLRYLISHFSAFQCLCVGLLVAIASRFARR